MTEEYCLVKIDSTNLPHSSVVKITSNDDGIVRVHFSYEKRVKNLRGGTKEEMKDNDVGTIEKENESLTEEKGVEENQKNLTKIEPESEKYISYTSMESIQMINLPSECDVNNSDAKATSSDEKNYFN